MARFGATSYSQNYEDVYIARAFSDVHCGFYIDVGAFHPVYDSITKIFYDTGWRGINIEPGPGFEDLARERPRDVNLRVPVTGTSRDVTFHFHPEMPGTSTILARTPQELVGLITTRETQILRSVTLQEVTERYAHGQHIHFLKLDCEGLEAEIVLSTDWHNIRPELLIIESVRPNTNFRNDQDFSEKLKRNGYREVFFDGVNVYHLRDESMARAAAFDRAYNVIDGMAKPDYGARMLIDQLQADQAVDRAARNKAEAEVAALRRDAEAAAARLQQTLAEQTAAHLSALESLRDELTEEFQKREAALLADLKRAAKLRDDLYAEIEALQHERAVLARSQRRAIERALMLERKGAALRARLSASKATLFRLRERSLVLARQSAALTEERVILRRDLRHPGGSRALRAGLAAARLIQRFDIFSRLKNGPRSPLQPPRSHSDQ